MQDQAGSIEMQTTFLGKEFSAFQGEVPISKVVQDHRYCEEAGVTADYYSDSTTQEFSLLRIKIFFPPLQLQCMPSPHVVYLGSPNGIQEQNLLLIKVRF